MAKYFYDNGFFNADYVMEAEEPFIFILGGRGTGKTYGFTRWCCENCDKDHKFIYMRRTEREMNFINTNGSLYSEHSPEVVINTKDGRIAKVMSGGGKCIGYHVPLSTIHNIRGFYFNDVSYIIFDEFIAERGTVIREFAGEQMLNAYETINRNRELNGEKPVKCIFLSNFNTAESDIMDAFGFSDELYQYSEAKPIGIYTDGLKKLIMINESPVSEKKQQTVLYQVTNNEDFLNMSLNNNGVLEIMPQRHFGRNSYKFLGVLGEININKLYSGYYYLTPAAEPLEIKRKDLLKYNMVYHAYLIGNVYTQNQYLAQRFCEYFE